jgi:pimeloyl-ACP methyl ester carboxylesterase
MKTRILTTLVHCTALALAACVPSFSQSSNQAQITNDAVVCQPSGPIPVSLAPEQLARYTVNGQLCATRDELTGGATVHLLIHGATYNRDYWDFRKIDGIEYSYARDMAAAGFPTFALDEIGAGNSSHPPSDQITVQSAAFVAHQVVQGLRSGTISGVPFGKVIIVGHSLGSTAVWEEAITYSDVDGVIVTGAAHSVTTQFLNANALYPAVDDPKFARSGLDNGYLTTKPGVRSTLFYSAPDYDPAIIARDEARKDVVPAAYLSTGITLVASNATQAIQVPVLTVLGGNDFTTCGPNPQGGNFDCSSGAVVATQEAPFYSSRAQIHACVIPASGHDINLSVNHVLPVADTVAWSLAFVGQLARKMQNFDGGYRSLSWNDGLPWNCGGPNKSE